MHIKQIDWSKEKKNAKNITEPCTQSSPPGYNGSKGIWDQPKWNELEHTIAIYQ